MASVSDLLKSGTTNGAWFGKYRIVTVFTFGEMEAPVNE
jgi:hypothetical protein